MSTDDTTPTPAPVAVPEGGWRDGDLIQIRFSNGDYEVVERRDGFFGDYADGEISRWMERAMVVSVIAPREAYGEPNDTTQHAPRPEPVTAPLPSEAVEALAWVFMRDRWFTGLDEERDEAHCDHMISNYGATWSPWQDALRDARAVLAAGYTLPAADQRARDEGTVRESYTVEQIQAAYDKHASKDDWGVPAFYATGLIAALRGEYEKDGSR